MTRETCSNPYEITKLLLEALDRFAKLLTQSSMLGEATRNTLLLISSRIGCDVSVLWWVDPDADVLVCLDVWHSPQVEISRFEEVVRASRYPAGVALPGLVWQNGCPEWLPDAREASPHAMEGFGLEAPSRSVFAVPIQSPRGVCGVLELFLPATPGELLFDLVKGDGRGNGEHHS